MRLVLVIMWALLAGCHSVVNGQPLRVMSFNIRYDNAGDGANRWSERRELVVDVVRSFNPDLLGTQECLVGQSEFLRDRLPEYTFFGVGRDNGALKGEMTALFYRTDRFDLLDSGHFWLSEAPDVPGSRSWDAALTRMASWVKLRDKQNGATLCYFNTHFDHQGEHARAMSAQLLRRRVLDVSEGRHAIITGDFNASADGPVSTLLRIGDQGGPVLLDTYRQVHPEIQSAEGTFNGFSGAATGARIDWIVVTPDVDVIDASIDRTNRAGHWPSDHFPVTAVVQLQPDE